jgi:hypothetical protein
VARLITTRNHLPATRNQLMRLVSSKRRIEVSDSSDAALSNNAASIGGSRLDRLRIAVYNMP